MNDLLYKILSINPLLEVFLRGLLSKFTIIKLYLKNKLKRRNVVENLDDNTITKNRNQFILSLKNIDISDNDIILIHSGENGFEKIGYTSDEILNLLVDIFGKNTTLVFTSYPLENIKRNKTIYEYNPKRSICWTGMLSNAVLRYKNVARSLYPYNTLAAIGPKANEIFVNDPEQIRPHDKNSGWFYLTEHHAKILFLGTTSLEANTILDHMAPDIMDDEWPINNWYCEAKYLIKIDDKVIEKNIEIQSEKWAKYVVEYYTDKVLKEKGIIKTIDSPVYLEIVNDAGELLEYIISNAKSGNLTYKIPKKYWKK